MNSRIPYPKVNPTNIPRISVITTPVSQSRYAGVSIMRFARMTADRRDGDVIGSEAVIQTSDSRCSRTGPEVKFTRQFWKCSDYQMSSSGSGLKSGFAFVHHPNAARRYYFRSCAVLGTVALRICRATKTQRIAKHAPAVSIRKSLTRACLVGRGT
jgi:hypothetical protein